jgi:predicted alpha/beta-fold hydrolase
LYPDFVPLFKNPHLATIAGNFWPRGADIPVPTVRQIYRIDTDTAVLALENQPSAPARAQLICVHGLEGSAHAGYLRSMAAAAVQKGFGVHRINLRSCGGTEDLCRTMYHSGLTSDTWPVLQKLRNRFPKQPLFLVGFSLGGNMVLKLAGEYDCLGLLAGLCAISPPIDLAVCVRAIDKPSNFLYARRFLDRLKGRIRRKSKADPSVYSDSRLAAIKSIWEFDDAFTAPLFGFGTAANYYATQSAKQFCPAIRIPTLIVAAQDDPLVPFELFNHSEIRANPSIDVLMPRYGGHLGFLSRRPPRFWLDQIVVQWIEALLSPGQIRGTAARSFASV